MIETITLLGLGALGSKMYEAYKNSSKKGKEVEVDLPVEEELLEVIRICSEIVDVKSYSRDKLIRLCSLCRKHTDNDDFKIEVKVLLSKLNKDIEGCELDFDVGKAYVRLKGLSEVGRKVENIVVSIKCYKAYEYLGSVSNDIDDMTEEEYSEVLELAWYEKKKLIVIALNKVFGWDCKGIESIYKDDLRSDIIELVKK